MTVYERKKKFILDRIKKDVHVTTSDRFFVEDYVAEFKVRIIPKNFGADICPDLTRTLKRMKDDKIISRWVNGLDGGMSSMGYPKWVWMYCAYDKSHDYRRKRR